MPQVNSQDSEKLSSQDCRMTYTQISNFCCCCYMFAITEGCRTKANDKHTIKLMRTKRFGISHVLHDAMLLTVFGYLTAAIFCWLIPATYLFCRSNDKPVTCLAHCGFRSGYTSLSSPKLEFKYYHWHEIPLWPTYYICGVKHQLYTRQQAIEKHHVLIRAKNKFYFH
jgi:hypothetical protein